MAEATEVEMKDEIEDKEEAAMEEENDEDMEDSSDEDDDNSEQIKQLNEQVAQGLNSAGHQCFPILSLICVLVSFPSTCVKVV